MRKLLMGSVLCITLFLEFTPILKLFADVVMIALDIYGNVQIAIADACGTIVADLELRIQVGNLL